MGVMHVNRFFLFAIQFCFLILLLTGCQTSKYEKSIADKLQVSMSKANIQYEEIYHLEVVKDGIVVFYKNMDGLNAGFIKATQGQWKWVFGGGSASLEPTEGLSWHVSNHKDVPLCYAYGVIANPNIDMVRTLYSNADDGKQEEDQAKVVRTDSGLRIWFVFYDGPIKTTGNFIGLSKNEEVLYQYKK